MGRRSLPSSAVSSPADDLDALSTDELRERAFAKASDAKDLGFFWDLFTHTRGAAGVGSEDASSGAVFETVAEAVAGVRQLRGHGDEEMEPVMRIRYLTYLRGTEV